MFSKVLVPQMLVIEKNDQISCILTSCLGGGNTHIERVSDLSKAKDKSLSKYSLIIADLNLKDPESLITVKKIRERRIFSPIILLGADILENKILSYNLGINIYHEKPIRCELLKAQINHLSLLFNHDLFLDLGEIRIDMAAKGIICPSGFIPLTNREIDILMLLIRAGGRVLSPKQIAKLYIAGIEEITESAIHTIISRIRAKLRGKISSPLILTRHQAGYSINHDFIKNLHFKLGS